MSNNNKKSDYRPWIWIILTSLFITFMTVYVLQKTEDLVNIIAEIKKYKFYKTNPSTKIFQALRIIVNNELEILQDFLLKFIDYLSPNGKIAIISYHSLEDRLVKHQYRKLSDTSLLKILTKNPIRPKDVEVIKNKRSKSAKLRVARKI